MALLEARVDGDALFFTRELTVSGDTAAVVTLRNILDRETISVLDEASSLFGPLQAHGARRDPQLGAPRDAVARRAGAAGGERRGGGDARGGGRRVASADRSVEGAAQQARSAPAPERRRGGVRAVNYLELVCPAGTPAALRAAIDAGADSVYCGFRDCTNARNYPGLNFDDRELAEGIEYAHARGRWVLVAINTFPRAGDLGAVATRGRRRRRRRRRRRDPRRHRPARLRRAPPSRPAPSPVGAGGGVEPAVDRLLSRAFGVSRVVLPRVLAVKEVAALIARMKIEAEVFAFGSLGTMVEGRCYLSSYITGRSPSSDGVCAPAEFVSYREEGGKMVSRLGEVMTNCYAKTENAAYPTPCKSRLMARGEASYLFEEPVGLNAASILKELKAAGVTALKIEGRQRSRAYVAEVVAHFRAALDALARGEEASAAVGDLHAIAEGGKVTLSAYKKGWR